MIAKAHLLEQRLSRASMLHAAARILYLLKQVPEADQLDVLAIVCAAFVQTDGAISSEAKRNSRETVLGPLKRKKAKAK